jgi:RHS repeat-associated protein
VDGVGLREESGELRVDTFVLSGAEDLVAVPGGSALGFGELGFVQWYRPRTEGLFARIERFLDVDNDYWKVWTKEGLVSYYGTPGMRGQDDATCRDPRDGRKVFGWKLSKTEDVFGNHIVYVYERDTVNVDGPHEWEQSYLKSVLWNDFLVPGNAVPQYLCRVDFVYGARQDAFSEYHAGFEVRTVRRCEEIQVWHDPQLEAGYAGAMKVKTYKLTYLDERVTAGELSAEVLPFNGVSLLSRVQVFGHDGSLSEALPPLDFGYSRYEPLKRDFRPVGGENLPAFSLAQPDMELVDLFGRGLPDVVQLNGTARYWRNLGDGNFALPRQFRDMPVGVHLGDPNVSLIDANGNGTADLMVQKAGMSGYYPMRFNGEWEERSFVRHKTVPSFSLNDPEVKLLDLDGDGVTDVLRNGSRFELFFNDRELGFHELKVVNRGVIEDFPEVSFSDPRVRIANLCGGLPAICMIYQGRIDYWPHMGRGVWGKRISMKHSPRFPDRFNPAHVIVGDLDGDGYDDIVYLEHDQITVWINQSGNGFAAPFVVKGTPPISDRDAVRIVDILGTGCPGLLWSGAVRRDESRLYGMRFLDLCGGQKPYLMHEMVNNLGARTRVEYLPSTYYYHLDQNQNLQNSQNFQNGRAGRWITPLPFPVLCVARVEVLDEISLGKMTTEYTYHHGYWDGEEREFRGFGRVDQRDTESFQRYNSPGLLNTGAGSQVDLVHFSPPTETRTWFHLGAVVGVESGELRDESWIEADFSAEYWQGDLNKLSRPDAMALFLKRLPAKRRREALRTLRGSILRSELYALDGSPLQHRPYTVSENQTGVAQVVYLDDAGSYSYELSFDGSVAGTGDRVDLGKYWLFFPHGISSRSSSWERGVEPMTSLSFQFGYDDYGHALQSVSLAVPRTRCLDWMNSGAADPFLGTKSEASLVHLDDATHYLIGRPLEARSWEVVNDGSDSAFDIVAGVMDGSWPTLDLIGHSLNYYDGAAFEGVDHIEDYGVLVRTMQLVLTPSIISDAYGTLPVYLAEDSPASWPSEYPADFQTFVTSPVRAGYLYDPLGTSTDVFYVNTMRAKFDFHDSPTGARGLASQSQDPLGNVSSVSYDDYDLLPVETTDALGMTVTATYDYRLMQPCLTTDPNGNRSAVRFSPLGFVVAAGVMGKYGDLDGDVTSDLGSLPVFEASSIMEYDLLNWFLHGEPAYVITTQHEWHINDLDYTTDTLVQKAFSDGFGRVIQTRAQAEEVIFGDQDFGDSGLPATQGTNGNAVGVENTSPTDVNVVVNGFQTTNNKGMVVEQWEPFYAIGWGYQAASHLPMPLTLPSYYGQKVVMFYDSVGRAVRTLNPDGTEQRVITGVPVAPNVLTGFAPTPWESYTYDANDLADLTHPGGLHNVDPNHYWTPRSVKVDALGRMIESTDRNYNGGAEEVVMQYFYDIRGNKLRVDDAIKVDVNPSRASAFLHVYDLANQPLKTTHIDKGVSTVVINAAGMPVEMRDAKGALVLSAADALMRPVSMWARDNGSESVTLRSYVVYGDHPTLGPTPPEATNHLGRPYKNYDEAGMQEFSEYDFKGQPKYKKRWVIKDSEILSTMPSSTYRVEWDGLDESTLLDLGKEFRTDIAYDALGRPVEITLPVDVNSGRKVVTPGYNRSGAIQSIALDSDVIVARIAYNAKGQRLLVEYGNGLLTRYAYDTVNFRLLRQKTEGFTLSGLTYTPSSGSTKQDCAYEYDLAGNIVKMVNATTNCGVGGSGGATPDELIRTFEYDALYRLVHATGRESGAFPNSSSPWNDSYIPDNTDTGTEAYARSYTYDKLGNMLDLYHNAGAGNTFHRYFNDFDTAPTAAFQTSNLATKIKYGGTTVNYSFDANGNMITEGTGRAFEWDYGDRMRGFGEGTTTAAYLYDAGGNRVKKVVRKSSSLQEVTVYIDGGFEYLYTIDSSSIVQEMNEIHVMDGRSRVARVREWYVPTWPVGVSYPEAVLYNLEDHLGNASFSFTVTGTGYSLEEYFPFGETSFGSFAKKRYRFCGKERDEESGLYYYGARYFAAWSCRFVSIDPLAGEYPFYTPFQYAGNQPINSIDLDGLEKEPTTDTGTQAVESNQDQDSKSTGATQYQWSSGNNVEGQIDQVQKTKYATSLPGPDKETAWQVRNTWTPEYVQKFRNYVDTKAKSDNVNCTRFTCEDFLIDTIIEFSKDNNLPFVLQNGSGTYDASSREWDGYQDFKSKVMSTTAAADFSNPEYSNAKLKNAEDVQAGDFILMFRNGEVAKHVSLVTKVSPTEVSGFQGGFDQDKSEIYNQTVWPMGFGAIWNDTEKFMDPNNHEFYLGSPVYPWKIDLANGKYQSQKWDGSTPDPILLSEYRSHEEPRLYQFNFYSWNR